MGGLRMAYTLTEAARATGLNKTTIFRAIRRGEISASRDAPTKQWMIEPVELHRVYPPIAGNDAPAPIAEPRNDDGNAELRVALAKLAAAEQRCTDAHDQISDLRRRLDAETEDRRKAQAQLAETQAKLTALLTDQRQPAPAAPPAPRRRWWHWK